MSREEKPVVGLCKDDDLPTVIGTVVDALIREGRRGQLFDFVAQCQGLFLFRDGSYVADYLLSTIAVQYVSIIWVESHVPQEARMRVL